VIFPEHCKYVGLASSRPCGDVVYSLSRYLLHETDHGYELLEVTLDPGTKSIMRKVISSKVLATSEDVCCFREKVQLNDRALLVRLASKSGYRCTIFTGLDEHVTFVLDPDISGFLKIHVYDVIPPRPTLSASLKEMEAIGLFGELSVVFNHHIRDITLVPADIYPCRAAGYAQTLDADPLFGGERVAGCLTAKQFCAECYGTNFVLENIGPLDQVKEEPFIARCCRAEREGIGIWNGKFGAIVHWGADPAKIARSVGELVNRWRKQ
jgi:hypothetical protein